MQSEVPLTLILSPLRAGRGELEHTCLGSLFGDPDTVSPKVPLSLRKRVRVSVRLHCMDTAKQGGLIPCETLSTAVSVHVIEPRFADVPLARGATLCPCALPGQPQ